MIYASVILGTINGVVFSVLAWLVGLALSIAILVIAAAVVRAVFWNPFSYGKVIHSLADKLSDAMDDSHAYKFKISGLSETSVSWAWICERAQALGSR